MFFSRRVTTSTEDSQIVFIGISTPRRKWADPGGTAIPGQPVTKVEQAPDTSSVYKNQFNIDVPRWGTYQILS